MNNAAAEFTFACPHCSQPISAVAADAGLQTQCPVCSQAFIVPLPPPPRRPFAGGARHQTANAASPTLAKRLYRVLAIVLLAAATIGAGFLLLKKKHAESGASQVTIPMERQLACTWEGLDGLHDTLTFAEDHGFRATYYAPSSRSGGKPLRLDCSGMWWSTGEDSFSFREGGEVSNGKIEGGALVLSRTGGTSLHFRKSLAQTNENSTEQEVPGDKARKLLFEAVENGDLSATFVLTLLQGNTMPSEEQVRNLCAQRRKRQAEEKAAIKSNSPEPIPAATTTAHKADPSVAGAPAVVLQNSSSPSGQASGTLTAARTAAVTADFNTGDDVQIIRQATLTFNGKPFKEVQPGWIFKVMASRPAERRIYLQMKDATGKPIAVAVEDDAVVRISLSERAIEAARTGNPKEGLSLIQAARKTEPTNSDLARISDIIFEVANATENLKAAAQQQSLAMARVVQLEKNAKVANSPNALDSNDTSYRQRTAKILAEAKTLRKAAENMVPSAKARYETSLSALGSIEPSQTANARQTVFAPGTPAVSAEKRVIKVTAKDLETSGKKFDNQTVVMDGTFIEINYYWVQHLNDIKFIGRGFIGFYFQDTNGEKFTFAFAEKEKWERQLSQLKKGEKRQFIGKVKNVNLFGDTYCLFIEDVQR